MNDFKINLLILSFFPLLLFGSYKDLLFNYPQLSEQHEEISKPLEYKQSEEELFCLSPIQLTLSHVFGRGVGHKGYSSAELFFIQSRVQEFYPYLDTRLHVMNNGRIALNIGGGFRSLLEKYQVSLGGNIYYDYRNSSHLNTQQIAGGFELLSKYVDFRLNGYLPLSGKKYSSALSFSGFERNQINVNRSTFFAFSSANVEIGTPILWPFPKAIQMYAAIGPYYLFGAKISENHYQSAWGIKFRFTADISRYLELGFELNHDSIFETTYQGFIAVRFPLYKRLACRPKKTFHQNTYSQRVLRPPIRNEIIPVKKKSEIHRLKFKNGEPIQVYFINNASSCPGIGTFESPFCSFAIAQNQVPFGPNLVYVLEGISASTPYNTNAYVMKQSQILQGSGTSITLNGVTIPAMTTGAPILTNPTGIGIKLASGTTLRGLTFQNTSSTSISGNVISGSVIIDQNTIVSSGAHGIFLSDYSGDVLVSNNYISEVTNNGISLDHTTFSGRVLVVGNTLINTPQSGVLIRLNHPSAYGLITRNSFNRNILPDASGFDIGTEVYQGALIIDSNTMQSNTQFNIHALDGFHVIRNNTVIATSPISGPGILYNCTDSAVSSRKAFILNNTVRMVTASNDGIRVTNNTATNASYYAELIGNTIQVPDPAKGLKIDLPQPGNACVSITGNNAPTFELLGTAGSINVQETQSQYQSQNQASSGFIEGGMVNFGSDCTHP